MADKLPDLMREAFERHEREKIEKKSEHENESKFLKSPSNLVFLVIPIWFILFFVFLFTGFNEGGKWLIFILFGSVVLFMVGMWIAWIRGS